LTLVGDDAKHAKKVWGVDSTIKKRTNQHFSEQKGGDSSQIPKLDCRQSKKSPTYGGSKKNQRQYQKEGRGTRVQRRGEVSRSNEQTNHARSVTLSRKKRGKQDHQRKEIWKKRRQGSETGFPILDKEANTNTERGRTKGRLASFADETDRRLLWGKSERTTTKCNGNGEGGKTCVEVRKGTRIVSDPRKTLDNRISGK